MSDNKNIDRLFQEKFKDYEVFPDPNVWKGIESELTKKKKRRIIPLWLRLAGAAAILLLLIPAGYWYFANNNNTKPAIPDTNIITDTDKNDELTKENQSSDDEKTKDSEKDDDSDNLNQKQNDKTFITTTQQPNQKNSSNKKDNVIEENIKINEIVENNEGIASQQKPVEQQENKAENQLKILERQQNVEETKVAISEKAEDKNAKKTDLIEELKKQNTEDKITNINDKKWSIGSTIGPVYLNTSSKGSPIDPSLANNTKTGNNSISYGLKVNYKISDKFSLQSGIQNVDLGYATENVSVIASSALLDNSKTNINSDMGATLQVSSTAAQNSETFSQRSPFDSNGSLDQSFSYVEVPLEAKYAIVQKKLGVNVVGGFSTYFLYDNDVSITSFGKKTSLGEASNLNDLNFSGNVGLDVNYNLSPNLYINASPMLKYQLNTFSENSGGFKPYFFGVYAGLNFRF
ncbi:hypothetical protein UMM65_05310 [Aureibaculum sp. 2210JD6-5]|uniref:outer membrane beta-barrel protein n=1 Tax=Aureibaculum sp. 2210JD6-5 TaxID=3103957 RepID=UPI002AAC68CC|nr:hypothetical protein [Aureibaculum sp. 2210JD6-5]MDY7394650.1 hypothetical protein [Aureibaculum sp. 2210JD6-5]